MLPVSNYTSVTSVYSTYYMYVMFTEAEKQEQINKASGEATAMLAVAEARSKGLQIVARALSVKVIVCSQLSDREFVIGNVALF